MYVFIIKYLITYHGVLKAVSAIRGGVAAIRGGVYVVWEQVLLISMGGRCCLWRSLHRVEVVSGIRGGVAAVGGSVSVVWEPSLLSVERLLLIVEESTSSGSRLCYPWRGRCYP